MLNQVFSIILTSKSLSICFFSSLTIIRDRDDYETRQGATSMPLTTFNVNEAPRPLHLKLRALSWFQTFFYRVTGKVHQWNSGGLSLNQDANLKRAKQFVKVILRLMHISTRWRSRERGLTGHWSFMAAAHFTRWTGGLAEKEESSVYSDRHKDSWEDR